MTELIVGTIVLVILAIAGFAIGHEIDTWWEVLCVVVGVIAITAALFGAIFLCFYGFNWKSAAVKAEIINKEYKTNYTQEQVFYASDVIGTIRQIQRTRFEIQGLDKKDGE